MFQNRTLTLREAEELATTSKGIGRVSRSPLREFKILLVERRGMLGRVFTAVVTSRTQKVARSLPSMSSPETVGTVTFQSPVDHKTEKNHSHARAIELES